MSKPTAVKEFDFENYDVNACPAPEAAAVEAEQPAPADAPPRRSFKIIRVDKCDDVSQLANAPIKDFDDGILPAVDEEQPEEEAEGFTLANLDEADKIVWGLNAMEQTYMEQAQRWLAKAQMYARRRERFIASPLLQRLVKEALPIKEGGKSRRTKGTWSGGNYTLMAERAIKYAVDLKDLVIQHGLGHIVQKPVFELLSDEIKKFRDKHGRPPGQDEGLVPLYSPDASYTVPKGPVTAVKTQGDDDAESNESE